MKQPTLSLDELEAPLSPITWKARSGLILESDPAVRAAVGEQMRQRCSGDLEQARTADEALDMIGGASRPFDVIFLGLGGPLRLESAHVLAVLRRQLTPSVVLAHTIGVEPRDGGDAALIGIADWLDLRRPRQWPRKVQQALDAAATLGRILARHRVPWHIDPALAAKIYGAEPGEPFVMPREA